MRVPRLLYNNPISPEVMDHAIGLLDLSPKDTVLDVGCGNGEILGRVLERYGCSGIGVDKDRELIDEAARRLSAHAGRVTLMAENIRGADLSAHSVGAALCVGSTHAFGQPGEAYLSTLRSLAEIVEPDGFLLVGEGYWRCEPDAEYLAATGMARGDFMTLAESVDRAEDEGLIPLYVSVSSKTDWDRFESQFWRTAEENLRRHSGSPEAQSEADHWRNWRRAYLRWGRQTLGFGLYLFRVPPESARRSAAARGGA